MHPNRSCFRESCPNGGCDPLHRHSDAQMTPGAWWTCPAPASRRWSSRRESAGRSFAAAAEPSTYRPATWSMRPARRCTPSPSTSIASKCRATQSPSWRNPVASSPVRGRHAHIPRGVRALASMYSHGSIGTDARNCLRRLRGGTPIRVCRPMARAWRSTPAAPRLRPFGCGICAVSSSSGLRSIRQGFPCLRGAPMGKSSRSGAIASESRTCFWQAADGTGEPERLLESDRIQMPLSFAPDGRLLFSVDVAGHGRDIHALAMDGSRSGRAHSVRSDHRRAG